MVFATWWVLLLGIRQHCHALSPPVGVFLGSWALEGLRGHLIAPKPRP